MKNQIEVLMQSISDCSIVEEKENLINRTILLIKETNNKVIRMKESIMKKLARTEKSISGFQQMLEALSEANNSKAIMERSKNLIQKILVEKKGTAVGSDLYNELSEILKKKDIPLVFSNYEADAQLALILEADIVQAIYSNDSDELYYGSNLVINSFNMDKKAKDHFREANKNFCKLWFSALVPTEEDKNYINTELTPNEVNMFVNKTKESYLNAINEEERESAVNMLKRFCLANIAYLGFKHFRYEYEKKSETGQEKEKEKEQESSSIAKDESGEDLAVESDIEEEDKYKNDCLALCTFNRIDNMCFIDETNIFGTGRIKLRRMLYLSILHGCDYIPNFEEYALKDKAPELNLLEVLSLVLGIIKPEQVIETYKSKYEELIGLETKVVELMDTPDEEFVKAIRKLYLVSQIPENNEELLKQKTIKDVLLLVEAVSTMDPHLINLYWDSFLLSKHKKDSKNVNKAELVKNKFVELIGVKNGTNSVSWDTMIIPIIKCLELSSKYDDSGAPIEGTSQSEARLICADQGTVQIEPEQDQEKDESDTTADGEESSCDVVSDSCGTLQKEDKYEKYKNWHTLEGLEPYYNDTSELIESEDKRLFTFLEKGTSDFPLFEDALNILLKVGTGIDNILGNARDRHRLELYEDENQGANLEELKKGFSILEDFHGNNYYYERYYKTMMLYRMAHVYDMYRERVLYYSDAIHDKKFNSISDLWRKKVELLEAEKCKFSTDDAVLGDPPEKHVECRVRCTFDAKVMYGLNISPKLCPDVLLLKVLFVREVNMKQSGDSEPLIFCNVEITIINGVMNSDANFYETLLKHGYKSPYTILRIPNFLYERGVYKGTSIEVKNGRTNLLGRSTNVYRPVKRGVGSSNSFWRPKYGIDPHAHGANRLGGRRNGE